VGPFVLLDVLWVLQADGFLFDRVYVVKHRASLEREVDNKAGLLLVLPLRTAIKEFISSSTSSPFSLLNSPNAPYCLWDPHETSCSLLTGDDFPACKCAEASKIPS